MHSIKRSLKFSATINYIGRSFDGCKLVSLCAALYAWVQFVMSDDIHMQLASVKHGLSSS
jgi:hypothetical protein